MEQRDLLKVEDGEQVPDGQLGITWRATDGPFAYQPYERVQVLDTTVLDGNTLYICRTRDPDGPEDLTVEVFGDRVRGSVGIVTWY